MGCHRDTFYEVRRAFQVGGVAAFVEEKRGPRQPHPNRVAAEIEAQVLDCSLHQPIYGAERVANELRLRGVNVSPSGVRGVWLRHELESRHKRLLRLEREAHSRPSPSATARSPCLSVTASPSSAGTWKPADLASC
jgi:hypothetical protein